MATKKKQKAEAAVPVESDAEIAEEFGAMDVVAGAEELDAARGLTRAATAGNLAAGASDLTPRRRCAGCSRARG